MEPTTEFDLDLALNNYLDSLNSCGILSQADQDELLDHLLLETDALRQTGLSEQEAFWLSQKRMGQAELLQSEYQKAKPWTTLTKLLVPAFLLAFACKAILNFAAILSQVTSILLTQYPLISLEQYLSWGNWGVQVLFIGSSLLLGVRYFQQMKTASLGSLWAVPVLFLISEIAKVAMLPLATSALSMEMMGSLSYHWVLVSYALILLGFCLFSGMLLKHRTLTLQAG